MLVCSIAELTRAAPPVNPGAQPPPTAAPAVDATARQAHVSTPATSPPPAPPHFVRLAPYRDLHQPIVVKAGTEVRFVVYAEDPGGAPLEYFARGLPPGSIFDPETQTFAWRPSADAAGSYSPIFIAESDKSEATLLVQIEVSQNRAPVLSDTSLRAEVGSVTSGLIPGTDPDHDPLVYSCSGLPKGATIDQNGRFNFAPKSSDVGQYPITVTVSDGQLEASAHYTIVVVDPRLERDAEQRNEWESYLQPGLGYHFYLPADQGNYAPFHGIDIQLSIVSFVHRNDNRGPSHGRFYLSARILHSTSKDLGPLFNYAAGMTLSMERNPQRSWLIPYYGLEVGGMTQPQMGGKFQSFVFGGVHLFASRNLFVNLGAGYLLVPTDMDDLAGFSAGANAEFSLW